MPPTPKAVRIRTDTGWQDIALIGPQGPVGPQGPTGPVGGTEAYEQAAQPVSTTLGALWIDTDDVPAAWVSTIPLVTALPSNPVDGQEVYFQDAAMATAGIMWHVRYRAAAVGSYKWEVIGGSSLFAESTAGQTVTVPTIVPPQLVLPLAGEYTVGWGGRLYQSNSQGVSATLYLLIDSVAQGYIDHYQGTAGAAITLLATNPMRKQRVIVAAANKLAQLRLDRAAGQAISDNRWIEAMPLRVG
jgi:hypothetical protein